MASATGIPDDPDGQPVRRLAPSGEDEPLLGRPGDMSQKEDDYLLKNLSTGGRLVSSRFVSV